MPLDKTLVFNFNF